MIMSDCSNSISDKVINQISEKISKERFGSPMIYSDIFNKYELNEKFIKELTELINKYNIDTKLDMHDFLIAELVRNYLASLRNAIRYNKKLKGEKVEEYI